MIDDFIDHESVNAIEPSQLSQSGASVSDTMSLGSAGAVVAADIRGEYGYPSALEDDSANLTSLSSILEENNANIVANESSRMMKM